MIKRQFKSRISKHRIERYFLNNYRARIIFPGSWIIVLILLAGIAVGVIASTGVLASTRFNNQENTLYDEELVYSIVNRSSKAVVEIIVKRPNTTADSGTGFILDKQGHIATNEHVINGASAIQVSLADGTLLSAEPLGVSKSDDLALLVVNPKQVSHIEPLKLANSDLVKTGQMALAIGNPLGLGGTVTAGIISARGRDIRSGPYDDYIQTDAPINRGNSGGPLFDMKGAVIGVNTAILSPSGGSIGIGFSVPANLAKNVISQLREFGTTRRGWLGVQIQTVSPEIAESLGLDAPKGALVAGVLENSPAEAAGVKQGDVIVEFDNREVPESRKLPRMVAETSVGKDVTVRVWRGGKEVGLTVRLGELEKVDQASITTRGSRRNSPKDASQEIDALGLADQFLRYRERFGDLLEDEAAA